MSGPELLTRAARVGFWSYVGTVLGAGFWGIVGARLDFPVLLQEPVARLDPQAAPNILSQYRFLRGLEAGFGLYASAQRKEVFRGGSIQNRLFLATMGLGLLGRTVSWIGDGRPRRIMLFFLFGELAGWTAIVAATRPWSRSDPPDRSVSGSYQGDPKWQNAAHP